MIERIIKLMVSHLYPCLDNQCRSEMYCRSGTLCCTKRIDHFGMHSCGGRVKWIDDVSIERRNEDE